MTDTRKISLLLADVDGTLLTNNKTLTEASVSAVQAVRRAGIRFAITSGRPPRGMAMLVKPLQLDDPIAAFNGGAFVGPDLSIIEQRALEPDIVRETVERIRGLGLDAWLYTARDWLVADPSAPHVEKEAQTVQFKPTVAASFNNYLDGIVKITAVSDDHDLVRRCETELQSALHGVASASRSQPYYLDVTDKEANKGAVADYLSQFFSIPKDEIATIGDSPNDVLMFNRSGFSIAMGNASDEVKAQAEVTTDSNQQDGFAKALRRFILGMN